MADLFVEPALPVRSLLRPRPTASVGIGCYTHQVLRLDFIDLYAIENIDTAVVIASEGGLCLSAVCAACAERMWPAPQDAEFFYKQSVWPPKKPRARRKTITLERVKSAEPAVYEAKRRNGRIP